MSISGKASHTLEAVEILQLSKMDGNKTCAECGVPCPMWASTTVGVFVCTKCASLHRHLGPEITRIKSTTLDNWTRKMVDSMKTKGNRLARLYYEEGLPKDFIRPTKNDTDMLRFLKNKYVTRKYVKSDLTYEEFIDKYGQKSKLNDELTNSNQKQKTLLSNEKTETESKPQNPAVSSQLNVLDELFGPITLTLKPKEVYQQPPIDILSHSSQLATGNSASNQMNPSVSNSFYNPVAGPSPSAPSYSDPMSNSSYYTMASSFSNTPKAQNQNTFIQAPFQPFLSSHASAHSVQSHQTPNFGNLQSSSDISYVSQPNQAVVTSYNPSSAVNTHSYTNQQTFEPKFPQQDSIFAYNLSGQQAKSVQNQESQPSSNYGTSISLTQHTPNLQTAPKDLINQSHQTTRQELFPSSFKNPISDDLFSSQQPKFSQYNASYFPAVNTQGSQPKDDLQNQNSTTQFTAPQLQSVKPLSQSSYQQIYDFGQSGTNPSLNSEFNPFNLQQATKQPPRF